MGRVDQGSHHAAAGLGATRFGQWVSEVLKHLHDPDYLESHPLSRYIPAASARRPSDGLHRSIVEAIEHLRRSSGRDPAGTRDAESLYLASVEGLTGKEIQDRLLISRSEYHRAQKRAANALIALLAQRWGALVVADSSSEATAAIGAMLPRSVDRIVGRDSELVEVEHLLTEDTNLRLLTIVGAPGAGKTRFAMEAARRLTPHFRDGVYTVALASVHSFEAVPFAIASALGLDGGRSLPNDEPVVRFFTQRHALLILDNFEHVREAANFVATLLSTCPALKVLLTSRTPLRLSMEYTYPIPPLSVPTFQVPTNPDPEMPATLERFDAVRLFVERARTKVPSFALSSANAQAVCAACTQVDGLPLAIELLAARIRTLSLTQIQRRLGESGSTSAGRESGRPTRHQSLHAAIAWSYDLLNLRARRLFRALGVFEGICSLSAIEAVLGRTDILDDLEDLVDHNLVRRSADSGAVLLIDMLATIRDFARELLNRSGELADVEARFVDYYASVSDRRAVALRGPHQIEAANLLDAETPNFLKAATISLQQQPPTGLQVVAALGSYWIYRSQLAFGRAWSERALGVPGGDTLGYARVRVNTGIIAYDQGDLESAKRYLEDSFAAFREVGNQRGQALALNFLGRLAHAQGDYRTAIERLEESRRIADDLGDRWRVGWTDYALGSVYEARRDLYRARALHRRANQLLHDVGDVRGVATALSGVGNVEWMLGEFEESQKILEEALRLQRMTGYRCGCGVVLIALAGLAYRTGDYNRAHRYLDEVVETSRQIGDRRNLRSALAIRIVTLKMEGRLRKAFEVAQWALECSRELRDSRGMAVILASMGDLGARVDYPKGAEFFRESLTRLAGLNDDWASARTVALIGLWALRAGQAADGLRALGAAEAGHAWIRSTIDYSNALEWNRAIERAEAEKGQLAAALTSGRAMHLERATAFAREVLNTLSLQSAPSDPGTPYSVDTRLE